jgi:hypothetical protein
MWTPEPRPTQPRMTLSQAIASVEGWYAQGSAPNRPQRNNNPGDIEYGPYSRAQGATGGDPRFAIFPDAATGWRCLENLLRTPGYASLTVEQAINRYAPPVENNDSIYLSSVLRWTGLTSDAIVGDVLA